VIPKTVYTFNGTVKTIIFDPAVFGLLSQAWVKDEVIYKNPFTGKLTRKNRGYYYTGTLVFNAASYDLMDGYRDLFNSKISDIKFYPNKDAAEYYDADMNEELDADDNHVAQSYLNVPLIFRSKNRYETALNYPVGYWGDRRLTFQAAGSRTFGT